MKYNNCLFFLSLWCKWESHLVLEQSSSPYCVLCYWSLLRTFVSGTWHSFISCSGIISSYFPSRSLLLHTAVLKTVGDPIFVHYFISWKVVPTLLRTHGCEMEPESCLNCGIVGTKAWEAWGMSEIQRACRDLVMHYGIFCFFSKRRCVSRIQWP